MTPTQRAKRRAENAARRKPINLGPCLYRTLLRREPYGGRKYRSFKRKWDEAATALADDWSHPERWPKPGDCETCSGQTYEEKRAVESMYERVNLSTHRARGAILAKSLLLPDELMTDKSNVLTMASRSPKAKLKDVRTLADMLGFAVMPFEYHDKRSYKNESYAMQKAIDAFTKGLAPWFNLYVLSPLHFYDVQAHVKSSLKEDLPIYAPKMAEQSFMAVSMTLPMFRTVLGNIEQLAENDRKLAQQVQTMRAELSALSQRVTDLAESVDRQRKEAAIAREREADLIRKLEEYEGNFAPYEPMLLAIPKETSIRANGYAIIGPCWGPDFPKIVEAVLRLPVVKGQRARLSAMTRAYGGESVEIPDDDEEAEDD